MATVQVGGLLCVDRACWVAGYPTTRSECVACHRPTRVAADVGVTLPSTRRVLVIAGRYPTIGLIARVILGGFWVAVTIGAIVTAAVVLEIGTVGGLVLLGVAILTGLYALHTFCGGRFRIVFW